jgi:hypothetical protein
VILGLVALGCMAAVVLLWHFFGRHTPTTGSDTTPVREVVKVRDAAKVLDAEKVRDAEKDPAVVPVAKAARITLLGGKVLRNMGKVSFEMNYRVDRREEVGGMRYVWVAQNKRRTYLEYPLPPGRLRGEGTMSVTPSLKGPPPEDGEQIDMFIEAQKPSQPDWRERVSNTLQVMP